MQEKAAFLEGFIKGLSMDKNSDYSKAIKEIVNCISEIADEIDDLNERVDILEEEMCDINDMLDGCSCNCGDDCCCTVKCEKCGTENNLTHEHIKNCDCNCKCQNCGCDLKIDDCQCCDEDCECED